MWIPVFFSFALLALLTIKKLSKIGSRPQNYPPGPPTLPTLGNLHQIPATKTHVQFKKWAEEYGPIYSLVLGTRTVIVLSSDQAVKDLLDKRGNIYSSRPDSYVTDLITGGLSFPMMKYGNTWKLCHKIFQSSINSRAAKSYLPYQDLENRKLLNDITYNPSIFKDHIRRYTLSLTTQIVLGFRTISTSDPKLLRLYQNFEEWSKLMGQAVSVLVDLFRPLQLLPSFLLPMRKHARILHQKEANLFREHWSDFNSKVSSQTAQPCVAHEVLKYQKKENFGSDLASYICGFLLVAGSDTIATQMIVFVQAMLLYPDVQKIAQEEVDRVCGDNIPTIDDPLPYVKACIKEVCRWMPAAILGIPHGLIQDDEYMGYRLPKDSVIITNVWAIHTDPVRYPDPRQFDPSRYLSDIKSMRESALSPVASDRDHFLFGAGRRLCVGIDIAENSLFLSFARILWAFRITKARDADGLEITPDPEDIQGGLAAAPAPFPAHFESRSEAKRDMVREAWRTAKDSLNAEEQWTSLT